MKKALSFHEVMPAEVWKWRCMESQIEQVLTLFDYHEIKLSVLQDYNTLYKGITALLDSNEAEQVTNQLLNLENNSSGPNPLSLRPEGTINVLNHVVEHLQTGEIQRIFYLGPMFRKDSSAHPYEFYQLGAELLGSDSILSDNEIIGLGMKIFEQLGLKDAWTDINSFGCNTCRPPYFKSMREFLQEQKNEYCASCYDSLYHNPLRETSCLEERCLHSGKHGPRILDYLCPKCKTNFNRVKKIQANLTQNYKVNHQIVKNFSYYNETVFNFVIKVNGRSEVIGGGGRYDFLSNTVTGKQIPAIGFYLNLDVIYSILNDRKLFHSPSTPFRVYVCMQSEDMEIILLQVVQELHKSNISTVISSDIKNTDAETESAGRNKCKAMIILRSDNLTEGKVLLKNLVKKKQSYIPLSGILHEIELIRKAVQVST